MMNTRAVSSLLALSMCLVAGPASADGPPAQRLRTARQALASYDAFGGTAEVLRELSAFIATAEGADAREARFLRAVAATDLLLIARGQGLHHVAPQVATALGIREARLSSFLDEELRTLNLGVYAEVANDCRWALRALDDEVPSPASMRDAEGERRDVLYVNTVVDALGQPDEVAQLAAFGRDPCSEEDLSACPTRAFSSTGRRAIEALREANAALERLEHVAASGEPLAASLAAVVMVDGAVLRTSAIRPTPALPVHLHVHGAGSRGVEAQPDVLFVVGADAIHYAHVPSVRVVRGEVQLDARQQPALPEWGRIPFRADGRAVVAPYDELVESLRPIAAGYREPRIGLGATSNVESLAISRVLLTMVRAGMPTPSLISRGLDDEARSLPVELVMGEDVARPLELFVRMGGFTLERPGRRSEDIPRVRSAQGLRFDLATLEERARAAGDVPASLRYMGVVDWGTVLDAALHLRPTAGELSLVLY